MSKKMKQFIIALLVLVMSISILAVPAAAATSDTPQVTIPVSIKLNGTLPENPDGFTIRVEAEDASCPLPEGGADGIYETTIKCEKGDSEAKKNLVFNFDKLGVYSYIITQIGCENTDCYHDKVSSYTLTISVVNAKDPSQGKFDYYVALRPEGAPVDDKLAEIIFTNKYANPVEIALHATKLYNNKTPKTGRFDFRLKDANGKVIETVSNVGKDVTFTPIVYDKVGTYTYKISEVIGDRPSVIYDKSVYTVTVDVTRDIENEGDYEATATYKKGSTVVDEAKFFNKSITAGNPFTGDQFRLVLWSSIMVGSLIAIVVLLFVWKKRKK